jgi:rsbT antagonist protein RsbS
MPSTETGMPREPLRVSILTRGGYLIASIHTALDDTQLMGFQRDLVEQIGRRRARGVIIDVAALDVIDSFASCTLRNLGAAALLRGAQTVVVGIRPAVALAMVTWDLEPARTALDLEDGLARLHAQVAAPNRT